MKIDALVGLRGYLALWVVVEHTLWACGTSHTLAAEAPSFGHIALSGGVAVRVFMILSGFLVARQLLNHRRPVADFLVRRIFRIYPAYVLALAVAVPLLGQFQQAWAGLPFPSSHSAIDLRLAEYSLAHLGHELRLHLLLLHGVAAGDGPYSILGPAWSLSVDWQFYLLAPVVLALVRRAPVPGAAMTMVAILALEHLTGGRFLIIHFGQYFWIGVLTHLALGNGQVGQTLAQLASSHQALLATCFLAAFRPTPENMAYAVWLLAVLAGISAGGRTVFGRILANPLAMALGEVSYSIYLMHMFCLLLALKALAPLAAFGRTPYAAAVTAATVLATIGVAAVTWQCVERPGQALGEMLGARLARTRRAAEPAGGTSPVKR
jgi:peptidoglycan/LPS O-acetylase OafA/YrhL